MDKRSPIWKYFVICETDNSKAECTLCKTVISRGGSSAKNYSTSAMNNHLRNKHADKYEVMTADKRAKADVKADTSSPAQHIQPTLSAFAAKTRKWAIDSLEARRVHEAIGRMIAVDVQPYSVVEDVGFKNVLTTLEPRYTVPSRKYFSTKIIPELYDSMRERVQSAINDSKAISFTTDTWTEPNTTKSFMSLTSHWIDDNLTRKTAVLHCELFEGSHTGARLAQSLTDMLKSWNVEVTKFHVIVHDNAANIMKAMRDADLLHVSCFAHSLQLCLHDAVLSQQSVADIVTESRKLVGHLKHSSSATTHLHAIQTDISLPVHQLTQDVNTRWNSTYLMLDRLTEQKRAVNLYLTEADNDKQLGLTTYQWTLMARVVQILRPFDQLTAEISADAACLSITLPAVQAILLFLQKDACDTGIKKTVSEIMSSLKKRFARLFDETIYCVTSALDPRFKLAFMDDDSQRIRMKADVCNAALKYSAGSSNDSELENDENPTSGDTDDPAAAEPPRKVLKVDPAADFWASWDSRQAQNQTTSGRSPLSTEVETEFEKFLTEPCQPRQSDPLEWWRVNGCRFPSLANAARRYLSAPPTSVSSERLFSTAGNVCSDKRSCLSSENVERLVFLKANYCF